MGKDDPDKIADEILRLFSIFRIMKEKAGAELSAPHPLDPRYLTLRAIEETPLPLSEIGRRLQRSTPNTSAIIERMAKDGLLRKRKDEKDRRIVLISITAKGRGNLEERNRKARGMVKRNLRLLTDREVDELRSSLGSINRIAARLI